MDHDKTIHVLDGGAVLAEWGPMRLVISAFLGKKLQQDQAVKAAVESFIFLERLAKIRKLLGQQYKGHISEVLDPLGQRMIASVMAVGDGDLTPMAAVAGTLGDAVADLLSEQGMTKVIVENGGDIAIRLRGNETVTVGIRSAVDTREIAYALTLGPESPSWGVATSGFGGRSLTRGVATAATVVARSASLADAAATALGNASYVEDREVVQRPAQEVDPYTDIPGIPVTVRVGSLSREKRMKAIESAMQRAEDLVQQGVVMGGLVVVQGDVGMTEFFRERLE